MPGWGKLHTKETMIKQKKEKVQKEGIDQGTQGPGLAGQAVWNSAMISEAWPSMVAQVQEVSSLVPS